MRGGKYISALSAQEHASSKNRDIFNFRVMAERRHIAMNVFAEEYVLTPGFLAFLEVKVLGKVLN